MTQLIVYTSSNFACPFCVRVKAELTEHSYAFEERDAADPAIRHELLTKRPSAYTVPQVFLLDGTYVGDCTETVSKIRSGQLDLLIELLEPTESVAAVIEAEAVVEDNSAMRARDPIYTEGDLGRLAAEIRKLRDSQTIEPDADA